MTTLKQQKQLTLNHSLEGIKRVITRICSLDRYLLKESNDLNNTYKILVYGGFDTGMIDINLTKIDENKSEFLIQINNVQAGNLTIEELNYLQDDFLVLLTNILDGKTTVKKRHPTAYDKKSVSYRIFFFILFLVVALAAFFIIRMLTS